MMTYGGQSTFEVFRKLEDTSLFSSWIKAEIDVVKGFLSPLSTVLDVGCGWGRAIEIFSPLCKSIVGIDISTLEIQFCRSSTKQICNTSLLVSDGRAIPFASDNFNVIVLLGNMFGTLCRQDRRALILEAKRVLKPAGVILVSTYSYDSTYQRLSIYKNAGIDVLSVKNGKVSFKDGWSSQGFRKRQLRQFFGGLDLDTEIIEVSTIGFLVKASMNDLDVASFR